LTQKQQSKDRKHRDQKKDPELKDVQEGKKKLDSRIVVRDSEFLLPAPPMQEDVTRAVKELSIEEDKPAEQPRVKRTISLQAKQQIIASFTKNPPVRTSLSIHERKEEIPRLTPQPDQKSEKSVSRSDKEDQMEQKSDVKKMEPKLVLQNSNPDFKIEKKKSERFEREERKNDRNDSSQERKEREDKRDTRREDRQQERKDEKREKSFERKEERREKEEPRFNERRRYSKQSDSKPPPPQAAPVPNAPVAVEGQDFNGDANGVVVATPHGWAIMNPSQDLQDQEKRKNNFKKRGSFQAAAPMMQPMINVQPMITQSGHMVLVTENGLCVPATPDMFQYQQWYDSVNQESAPSYYYNTFYSEENKKT
jgi:hypothetical protein